jgi:glycerophosphoryl diester phosphodiesterase
VRRVGHKGADAIVPGNTLESFAKAVEIGVDMIELDVLPTRDGRLLIAHDFGDAKRREPMSLDECLDAFTEPPLESIPFDLDLKLPAGEDELAQALRDRDLLERASLSTMEVTSLRKLYETVPTLRLGWTLPKTRRDWTSVRWARPALVAGLASLRARLPAIVRRRAGELGVSEVWAYHQVVTRRLAGACHDAGLELMAWTIDEVTRMREVLSVGADGIVSNDPTLFAEL